MSVILKYIRSIITVFLGSVYSIAASIVVLILIPILGKGRLVDVTIRFWARLLLFTAGVKVAVEGSENIDPTAPYVFISNHQSTMDIPVCVASIPSSLRMLAKKELFRIPIFGWAIMLAGFISL